MFALHPQLKRDCALLGCFPLSQVLLMLDANYPWLILVPQRDGIQEIYQLTEADQQQLLKESAALSRVLVQIYSPDKLNIAALGNVVPQLHQHHIVRFRDDPAWPAPVWGKVPARPYANQALIEIVEILRQRLTGKLNFTPSFTTPNDE